jgi:hypothetical protein
MKRETWIVQLLLVQNIVCYGSPMKVRLDAPINISEERQET